MINGRALHFVFKVVDRQAAWVFFTNVLGMKVKLNITLTIVNLNYDEF